MHSHAERGNDRLEPGNIYASSAAAFAASLKLDSSHIWIAAGSKNKHTSHPLWEPACPRWRRVSRQKCQPNHRYRRQASSHI